MGFPRGQGGPPYGGRGPQQQEEMRIPSAQPVVYLETGKVNATLFDEEAERWAKEFKEIATSQLRRFYEHVVTLRRTAEIEREQNPNLGDEGVFERIRPEFKMMKAKAAYTAGRADRRDKPKYLALLQFCVNHTHSVKTMKDFEVFCRHFESVVAFHKFYEVKGRGN
ncbi:MAG TPA: type III-A CRISPR-associated protein Csm2 [Paludibaculum sp.]